MNRAAPAVHASWRMPALVIAATVLVFGAVAFRLTLLLREDLQEQILRREAEGVRSMIELQQKRAKEEFAKSRQGAERTDWFSLLLETSQLRGVVALWLFDVRGTLQDGLGAVAAAQLGREDWNQLQASRNLTRLHPLAALAALSGDRGGAAAGAVTTAPLLEVLVPLRDPVNRPVWRGRPILDRRQADAGGIRRAGPQSLVARRRGRLGRSLGSAARAGVGVPAATDGQPDLGGPARRISPGLTRNSAWPPRHRRSVPSRRISCTV